MVGMSLLYVQGMRQVVQGGIDVQKAMMAGLSFWLGVEFQNQLIFPDVFAGTLGVLLSNGQTEDAVSVPIAFSLLLKVDVAPMRTRLSVEYNGDAFTLSWTASCGSSHSLRAGHQASTNRLTSAL